MEIFDFIAFDVETANHSAASICQIGLVGVSKGEVVFRESYYIKPPGNEYDARHSCIHGIDALKTQNSPLFPDVWNLIRTRFQSNLLVAHNMSFDLNMLAGTLVHYNLEVPELRCECTYRMSGLNLKALCESLQITLTDHHDALADATACAMAYLKMKYGFTPDHSLIKARTGENMFAGHERITGELLKPCLENADPCNPFYGKKVVFTGELDKLSRDEAAKHVKSRGADIDTGVTRRTNFVIIGKGAGPSKLKKIEQFNAQGSEISIIDESRFLDMLHFKQ